MGLTNRSSCQRGKGGMEGDCGQRLWWRRGFEEKDTALLINSIMRGGRVALASAVVSSVDSAA